MAKVSINTFERGMNLDTSRVVQAKNTAQSITNFRPWTDSSGKVIGGLVNIEGNELSFSIPDTSPVYQFVFSFTPPVACPATTNLLFELGGGATLSYNPAVTMCGNTQEEIVDAAIDFINTDATLIANNIRAYKSETDTMLVAHLGDQDTAFNVSDGSPDLAKSVYLASQANVQPIGWTTIRDDYYLFTTNDATTTGGAGQIWKLVVDEVDYTATLSIVYNAEMNLSTKYPIEAVGRYENDCTKRLYWTDNFNQVRTLNAEADDVFFTPVDNITLIPSLFHSIPVLQSIQGGGALESGIWQFAYRLRTATGGETSFSPVSRMVPIVEANEDGTNYWEYLGGNSGVNTGKSVTIKIDSLDEDYTWIELISLYRSTKQSTPVITVVTTQAIDVEGEFEFTVTGNELNSYELSLEEFLLASRAFTHAKTLTSKDNRLFAANTKYEGLELDYDTRAYAHAVSSTTFNIDGVGETVFANIDADANCINDDYSVNKFKQSSTLYGGTGTNISYEIKTRQILADNKILDSNLPGGNYDSLPIRDASGAYSTFDLNEGVTYPQPNLWKSLKNPYVFDLFKGYQRDEIYRFAIVFYDKQGNPGYANWIADIKIPEAFDSGRSVYSGGDDYTNGSFRGKLVEKNAGDTYYNIPYVEFDVDVSSIQDQISGYSIVRVERRKEDRTVVGQGLAFRTGPLIEVKSGATKDLSTPMGDCDEEQKYLFAAKPGISIEDYGDGANDYDPAAEGFTSVNCYSLFDYASEYMTVQFPEHLYTDEIFFSTGDTIKTVDTFSSYNAGDYDWNYKYVPATDYQSIIIRKQYDVPDATTFPSINAYGTDSAGSPINNLEVDIEQLWKIPEGTAGGEVAIDNDTIFRNENYSPYDPNAGSPTTSYHGWGQKTLLIKLDNTDPSYPLYSNSETLATAGTHPNIFSALGPELTTSTATNDGGVNGAADGHNHYVVNYKRTLANQYGGNTYIDKTQNIYISTGNFVQVNEDYVASTVDVYGGDTFMTVMDVLKFAKSWDWGSDFSTPRKSMTFLFPVESPIHTEYRHGRHVQSHGFVDSSTPGQERNNDILTTSCDVSESYLYNTVFSADNDIIKFYAKPFDFQPSECTELFDTRIYGSEPKVNGETKDSWRAFGTNEFIDLESLNGPINKIYTLNDNFFSFQDRAIATVAINPRVQTTTTDGSSLELGTGAVLHDYTYLSNSIGCKHQWGVIAGRSHLYWIDINNNKLYRVGAGGMEPLSDVKGIFSYLDNSLIDEIRRNELNGGDNPIEDKGINGYYDYKFNEVVFTAVGNGVTYRSLTAPFDTQVFNEREIITAGGNAYEVHTSFTYNYDILEDPEVEYAAYITRIHSTPKGFTVCYNEFNQAFSAFYTFESPMYFYNPLNLFSVDSVTRQDIYQHNVGDRAKFYGYINDSQIKFYGNDMPLNTKTFDNLVWHTESTTPAGADDPEDTFNELKCETTYQDSGYITLGYNVELKRKERTWQTHVPRSTTNRERMRDKHMEIELTYFNTDNNRLVVHFIGNSFRPSFR